jgi:catechol 2,3-dioxygenase-like lactoylglutathione lyase family enzyme
MIPARVSVVCLGTKNFAVMRDFYRKLGWEEHDPNSVGFTAFKTGGAVLTLFPLDGLAEDAHIGPIDPSAPASFRGVSLAINVEKPALVDEVIADVRKAGATILREPSDAFWGGRTAYFADPEGHVWEVAWNPGVSLDARGNPIWT